LVKQLKSTYRDLSIIFEKDITAKHVSEELQSCAADEKAEVIQKHMEKLDFDILGIQNDGIIYGYVERVGLGLGPCKKYERLFRPSEIISSSTPLIDLLKLLHDVPRIFVTEHDRVTKIVTRGDLQKAPVRMLYFGLITLLEMQLLRLIRENFPNSSWKKHLSKKRLDKAEKLRSMRKKRNEDLDLADCLEICDKIKIVCQMRDIREFIENNFRKLNKLSESIQELRNKLAHANDLVEGSTWPCVISLAENVEQILCFLEKC
jgi:hypothetical protein